MYIQARFGSYRSIESTKTDWNCTRKSIFTCFAQTSDRLPRLTQTYPIICKPAFFLNTEDLQLPQTKNETPATVEPNATASTPATVESDPTASTPTQPSTRSGRKVHLPTRYR
ncbi:hypothetical protein TNCV_4746701 [Trichonephila clavipes]|nr:hypothetical protein TNCV_4746701 [Trichonephila clavipes]